MNKIIKKILFLGSFLICGHLHAVKFVPTATFVDEIVGSQGGFGVSITFPYGGIKVPAGSNYNQIYTLLNMTTSSEPEKLINFFISTGAKGSNTTVDNIYKKYIDTKDSVTFIDRTSYFDPSTAPRVSYVLTTKDNDNTQYWFNNKVNTLPAFRGQYGPSDSLMLAVFGCGYTNNYSGAYYPTTSISTWSGGNSRGDNAFSASGSTVQNFKSPSAPSGGFYYMCDSTKPFGQNVGQGDTFNTDYAGFYRLCADGGSLPYYGGVFGPIYKKAHTTPLTKNFSDFYKIPSNWSVEARQWGHVGRGWNPDFVYDDANGFVAPDSATPQVAKGNWLVDKEHGVPVVRIDQFYTISSDDSIPYKISSDSLSTYEGNNATSVLPYFIGTGTDNGYFPVRMLTVSQHQTYVCAIKNGLAPYAHEFVIRELTNSDQPACIDYYNGYIAANTLQKTFNYWAKYLQRNSFEVGPTPEFQVCSYIGNQQGPYNYTGDLTPSW